ncbi:MAG: hypothetical protein KA713_03645 [Chryseotalea sp. WA131a]|nr:MAG: hypothetical protein KA713_03645 [Chryseotalea sp. WA131a]
MRKIFVLIVVLRIFCGCDTPEELQRNRTDYFLKFYGNDGNQTGVDFVMNDDGTFVLVGNSQESATSDLQIYVVKINQKGEVLWQNTYGSNARNEEAKDIELLKNGELIIAGNSKPKNVTTQSDVYLLKLNQDGGFVDSVRQGTITSFENVSSVTEVTTASDSSELIVAGSISGISGNAQDTDAMHMRFKIEKNLNKLKRLSELEWKTRPTYPSFGFQGVENATKVVQYDNNTFYVFGSSNQLGKSDFWYYSLSNKANAPINSTLIGKSDQDEVLTSVTLSKDQTSVVLAGTRQGSIVTVLLRFPLLPISPFTPTDLKLSEGDQYSQPRLAIGQSGYWVAAQKASTSNGDIVVARTNVDGTRNFEHLFGESLLSQSGSVAELPDGRVVTIGTMALGGVGNNSQLKMVFMKLNSSGRLAP